MENKLRLIGLIFILIICITINTKAEQDSLIPPDAHPKAIKALKTLGPDRGALTLSSKVVAIIGVVSELSFDQKEINKNLKDLNATITDTEIKIAMSGDVLFDFDRWNIRKDAEIELKKVVKIINAYKSTEIIISGHTDSRGNKAYNHKLSLKRAQSVKDWIIKNSTLPGNSFGIFGYGKTKPIAPNQKKDGSDNPAGRQKNRRVEFIIKILKK